MSVNARIRTVVEFNRSATSAAFEALLILGLLFSTAGILSAQNVTFHEYQLPGFPSPTSITSGPDGALWFTEYFGNKIGRITTAGVIAEYPVPMVGSELAQLGSITVGPDGALWFTENYAGKIGRITTAGILTEYMLPSGRPGGMTVGPDGALWFTESDAIGRITTAGTVTHYPLPSGRGPNSIAVGLDDALWFTDITNNQIGRMTMDGNLTAEYPLSPISCFCAVPAEIAAGPDGALWFAKDIDKIGRISLSGDVTLYQLAPHRWPGHFTTGPDGALWFTEAGGGSYGQAIRSYIGRITTSGTITEYTIPTQHSNPGGLTLGPDGALWFTEQVSGKIGQLVLPDTTPPVITLSANPRILWPPSGKMVAVTIWGTIKDVGSGLIARSVEYAVTDEYHRVQPRGPMMLDAAGNYAFQVLLHASREGNDLDGRQYVILVRARDNAGNRSLERISVIVPHDRR